MSDDEIKGVRIEYDNFIEKDPKPHEKFSVCDETDKEWILDYLSSGKV